MSVERKNKYEQFGKMFGRHIHAIEVGKTDPLYKNKPEELAIKIPAQLSTIKSVEVNTIRKMQIAGGAEVIVINGGDKEVTIGVAEKLVSKVSDYSSGSDKKVWFDSYTAVKEYCNASNRAEAQRLRDIAADAIAQAEMLESINDANERGAAIYEEA